MAIDLIETLDTETPDDDEEEAEAEPLKFEELLARFKAKMATIPAEYHEAMGLLYLRRFAQEERKRVANRQNQLKLGKRVFWGHVLPPETIAKISPWLDGSIEALQDLEKKSEAALREQVLGKSWYHEVAVVAARGFGISDTAGVVSAAKILWAYGKASRFPTFGCIVRYSRLAPENGKAPGKAKGHRIHYNPAAWQALFDLSEIWLRNPGCCWRIVWDDYKALAVEKHPDWPKWKIHAWGRRKTLREFLRELYDVWLAWEARQQ